MTLHTEALQNFLALSPVQDLAALYTPAMEVQVNVAQDGGSRIDSAYKGKSWHGWTDGLNTWKPFRIPWNAWDEPRFDDRPLRFDLSAHAEAIGLTGWDWVERCSRWLGFDFDSLVGHKEGLSADELAEVRERASAIPWVTTRASTSGRGLHLYVFLDPVVPTKNHTEHAALARAVLAKLSATVGFDFAAKVDCFGGVLWIWHRKLYDCPDGLKLIKQGVPLDRVPANWRDHQPVTRRRSTRSAGIAQDVETVAARVRHTELDATHRALIAHLEETESLWWWDPDRRMLVAHTYDLAAAATALELPGRFETVATGKDRGADKNCFAFPLPRGGWMVRRYGKGAQEGRLWRTDSAGWTYAVLGRPLALDAAAKACGGVKTKSGEWHFEDRTAAAEVLDLLGSPVSLEHAPENRTVKIQPTGPQSLRVAIRAEPQDENVPGFARTRGWWESVTELDRDLQDGEPPPDIVRHVTAEGEDEGFYLLSKDVWTREPPSNIQLALASLGIDRNAIQKLLGSEILDWWRLVSIPFQDEYPGGRQWNRDAAHLAHAPSAGETPHWDRVLAHIGTGVDAAVAADSWCRTNEILLGTDWLRCWIAALFQEPTEPLPYLFLFGPQNSGKSILHEALELLFTRGYARADAALQSSAGFNGEIAGAVLCVVEETDLRDKSQAYNRIKDWVTGKTINIHPKGGTPYLQRNCTHWIQTANAAQFCPVLPGDTRIVVVPVLEPPANPLPKSELIEALRAEAPAFLDAVLGIDLPRSPDRLRLPPIETPEKERLQRDNRDEVEIFLDEQCEVRDGFAVTMDSFYEEFLSWLDPGARHFWTRHRLTRKIPDWVPRGRLEGEIHLGNLALVSENGSAKQIGGRLRLTPGGTLESIGDSEGPASSLPERPAP